MAAKRIKDELLEHDYDGIQELDNDLPPWWLYLFYITIAWSVVYLLHYHVLGTGDLQEAEYLAEMQAAEKKQQELRLERAREGAAAALTTQLSDEASLASGKAVYTQHCLACHGAFGEGGVGPNMTDEYWIHGGNMTDVVNTILDGVPAKGMISWRPILKPQEVTEVASYILSLQGTNPANAKAPEGEKAGG